MLNLLFCILLLIVPPNWIIISGFFVILYNAVELNIIKFNPINAFESVVLEASFNTFFAFTFSSEESSIVLTNSLKNICRFFISPFIILSDLNSFNTKDKIGSFIIFSSLPFIVSASSLCKLLIV